MTHTHSTKSSKKPQRSRVGYDQSIEKNYDSVRTAMRTMQQEILDNEGIYPKVEKKSSGIISQAEVARRAKIHPVTLNTTNYEPLLKEVKAWMEVVKSTAVVGSAKVRRTLSDRLGDWRDLYGDLQEQHMTSETDLLLANEKVARLEKEAIILRDELHELRRQLADATSLKVVPFRHKKS